MDDKYIQTQLLKFNLTNAVIAELQSKYKGLVASDIESYKAVKSARIVMKNYRVDVDRRRKELTEDALKYQRAVNAEAKRITALLTPIEDELATTEKAYEEEQERLKVAKEQAEAIALQARINKLFDLAFMFNGTTYKCEYFERAIAPIELKNISDENFQSIVDECVKRHDAWVVEQKALRQAEAERKAKEEADRKAEQDRLAQQRREQELEQERLADIAREQTQKEAALKAEADRIESLKKYEESKAAVIACEAEGGDYNPGLDEAIIAKPKPLRRDYIVNDFIVSSYIDDLGITGVTDSQLNMVILKIDLKKLDNVFDELVISAIKEILIDAYTDVKHT